MERAQGILFAIMRHCSLRCFSGTDHPRAGPPFVYFSCHVPAASCDPIFIYWFWHNSRTRDKPSAAISTKPGFSHVDILRLNANSTRLHSQCQLGLLKSARRFLGPAVMHDGLIRFCSGDERCADYLFRQ